MMEQDTPTEENRGSFNYAISYLERLNELEKAIDISMVNDNYTRQFPLLNALWLELDRWMAKEPKEEELHKKLKQKAFEAHNHILNVLANKQNSIERVDVEASINWLIALRRYLHKLGLTMPKRGDPGSSVGAQHY